MRFMPLVFGLFLLGSAVDAQTISDDCSPLTKVGSVDVETVSDGTFRGTLFCLSPDEVTVLRDGQLVRTPLSQVRRVRKPVDPVWDGALKGAAVVLTIWGVGCGFCNADSPLMWRAVGGYALLGVTFDALQPNRTTIFGGKGRPSIAWRVGF